MSSIDIHPSELAYAFYYAKAEEIIGWGLDPFMPKDTASEEAAQWLTNGERLLREAGRLVGTPDAGLNFSPEIASAVLALVNPAVVLMAERKIDDLVRRLSVHVAGPNFIGLSRREDGMFELTRYADLTAAAGACAGFLGTSLAPLEGDVRVETTLERMSKMHQDAKAGNIDAAIAALVELGAPEPDAACAVQALAKPAAAGVLSVFYCATNKVQDAEPFSVMTTGDDKTWLVFSPASIAGPIVLERSSAAALTARVAVGIAARYVPAD